MAGAAKKWVKTVKTDSTHPPEGLFTRDPETIAGQLASEEISPKGPGSGAPGTPIWNFVTRRTSAHGAPGQPGP